MNSLGIPSVTSVVCPPWCNVTQSTHVRELRWEGRALHWSDARTGEGWEIRHTCATDAEGRPAESEPQVYVTTNGGLTLAGAEALALTLLAAYEEATD
jgi:hypothetical protein